MTFGTGDLTVEMRVKLNAFGTAGINLLDFRSTNSAAPWAIDIFGPAAAEAYRNEIHFYNGTEYGSTGAGLTTGVWYAIAWTRTGGTSYLFVDGVEVGSFADSNNYTNGNHTTRIGDNWDSIVGPDGPLSGWMDELRITKGVARYTGNYTIATEEFPTSGPA